MPRFRLIQCDAVEALNKLKPESIDCIIFDPAYESLEKHRAIGTTTRLTDEWFQIFPNTRFSELFAAMYRVMKPNSHLYMFSDQETMFVVKPVGERTGFRWWKFIVWDKVSIGMGYHYRNTHELVLFFEKGKRKLNNLGVSDVLTHKRVYRGYPTEKPDEIATILIENSTDAGEVVLDCFCGSGSTGDAALTLNRRFIGIDISESAIKVSRNRLSIIEGAREQV